jgi:hypothetical protein
MVYRETGSSFLSALVFSAQWLMPIFSRRSLVKILGKVPLKKRLVGLEIAAGVVSLLVGFVEPLYVVLGILLFRGYVEVALKSTRIHAVKVYFDGEGLMRSATLTQLGQILGIALGGGIIWGIGDSLSLATVAIIDFLTFAFAASLYLLLPNPHSSHSSEGHDSKQTLEQSGVVYAILHLSLVTAVFQGLHNALRVPLPLKYLGLSSAGVGLTQLCFIGGVATSALLVAAWPNAQTSRRAFGFSVVAFLSILATFVFSSTPVLALCAYFLMAASFEIIYLFYYNRALVSATPSNIGAVSVALGSWPFAGMALSVPLLSISVDQFQPIYILVGVAIIYYGTSFLFKRALCEKELS